MTVLREGDRGHAVSELHQALLERGLSVDQLDLDAEMFGSSTRAAVVKLQLDVGLAADGIVGAQTWAALRRPPAPGERFTAPGWRCEPSQVRDEVRPAVEAAFADLGRPTVEDPPGSNRGRYVDAYGVPGLPWCAAAASSWVMRAPNHRLRRPLMSAWKWKDAATAAGWLLGPAAQPQPGDVAITGRLVTLPDGRQEWRGHVGLVVHVLDSGDVCTIEGNSGNAVRGVVRPRLAWPWYARPIALR